jgi:hypothetical protein
MRFPVGAKSSALWNILHFIDGRTFAVAEVVWPLVFAFVLSRTEYYIDNILRVECCRIPLNGQCLPSEYIVSFFLF